jgi:hypothetical protein
MNESLLHARAVDGSDVTAIARKYLGRDACLIMSIVPTGKTDLAVKN